MIINHGGLCQVRYHCSCQFPSQLSNHCCHCHTIAIAIAIVNAIVRSIMFQEGRFLQAAHLQRVERRKGKSCDDLILLLISIVPIIHIPIIDIIIKKAAGSNR